MPFDKFRVGKAMFIVGILAVGISAVAWFMLIQNKASADMTLLSVLFKLFLAGAVCLVSGSILKAVGRAKQKKEAAGKKPPYLSE